MRKDKQSAADDADAADAADESFDGVRIEAITPRPSSEPAQPERFSPEGPLVAPG
jgi:hypothetical protein